MPHVNIKGLNTQVSFPDEMTTEQMEEILRRNFSTNLFDSSQPITLPKIPQTVEPVQKSLAQRAGQGVSDFLFDQGIISNRFGAQEIGSNLSTIGEFLPVVGDAAAGDDFGKALAEGDKLGMAMAGLAVIPVLGDVAKKGIKKAQDLLDRTIIDRLPEFQKDAVLDFATQGSARLNKALRAGKDPRSRRLLGDTEGLDFAIESSKLPVNVNLFRKVDAADIPELKGNLTGKEFIDKGYLSTTTDRKIVDVFDDNPFIGKPELKQETIFNIKASKGMNALPLPGSEKEVILPRGAVLKVSSDKIVDGIRIIDAVY